MVNMQFLILPFANIARPKGDPKNTKGDVSSGRQTCHRDGMTPRPPAAIPALMLMTVEVMMTGLFGNQTWLKQVE